MEEILHFLFLCQLCNPNGAIQVDSSCPQSHQVTTSESSRAARASRVIQGFSLARVLTFFILPVLMFHTLQDVAGHRLCILAHLFAMVHCGCFTEHVPVLLCA